MKMAHQSPLMGKNSKVNDVIFYPQYDLEVVGWEDLLSNFNDSVLLNEKVRHKCLGFFVSHSAQKIPKVEKLMKNLNCESAHLYFNVSTHGGSFGKHVDDVNVYFWQCQGQNKWVFEDQEHTLKPGDMIFIPKGIAHNVIPISPRAGISMGDL